MRPFWWYLAGIAGVFFLACAALVADAAAHPDGCHRWHSCPSDDGGYVCGDRGHCSECPDNQFCLGGRARGAAPTATRPPRPTRPPEPTDTPRPARDVAAPRSARTPDAGGAVRGEAPSPGGPSGGPFGATGAPLAAAPGAPRGAVAGAPEVAPATAGAPAGDASRREAAAGAELAGVRLLGPVEWTAHAEGPALAGVVHNAGAEPQTVVLVLALLDAQGERLGVAEAVLWDLAPGESRAFVQPLPPLAVAPTEVRARLERLAP